MKDCAKIIEFMVMAVNTCAAFDEIYEFTCPICGGKAWVLQASCDERYMGACEDCGMQFTE